MTRVEEILAETKLKELLKKEDDTKDVLIIVLAIIGAVVAVAGIAFAVYKFMTPDLEDYEDDLDDDFDDYFSEEDQL